MSDYVSYALSNPLLLLAACFLLYRLWGMFARALGGGGGGGGAALDLGTLLPPQLLDGDALVPTSQALGDSEYVLLYASAHWCPPCRAFTPRLSAWAAANAARLKAAVVFVSLDRDETAFRSYRAGMSWRLAVPWAQAQQVLPPLQVWGIPALLVVRRDTGAVLTREGVAELSADERGERFPWPSEAALQAQAQAACRDEAQARTPADAPARAPAAAAAAGAEAAAH